MLHIAFRGIKCVRCRSFSSLVRDSDIRAFVHDQGGHFTKRVQVGASYYGGQNLIATTAIQTGQTLVAVPEHLSFSNHSLTQEDNPYRSDVTKKLNWDEENIDWVKDRARRAVILMYEFYLGRESKYSDWLQYIPAPDLTIDLTEQTATDAASQLNKLPYIGGSSLHPKYLKELQGTSTYQDIASMKLDVDRVWSYAYGLVCKLPASINRNIFKREYFDYFMALAMYRMRPQVGPLIDLVQHARIAVRPNCLSHVFEIEKDGKSTFVTCLIATQLIMNGEELFIASPTSTASFSRLGQGIPVDENDNIWLMIDKKIGTTVDKDSIDTEPLPDWSDPHLDENGLPLRRFHHLKYNPSYQKSYEENETWGWFMNDKNFDTTKLAGSSYPLKLGFDFPSRALFEYCVKSQIKDEDTTQFETLPEYMQEGAMGKFTELLEERLAGLPFSLEHDLKWLEDFKKRDKTSILNSSKPDPNYEDTSTDDLDYIMHDIVYTRSAEKVLLKLHMEKLTQTYSSPDLVNLYPEFLSRHKYTKKWMRDEFFDIPTHLIPPDTKNPFVDENESADDVQESLQTQFAKNLRKMPDKRKRIEEEFENIQNASKTTDSSSDTNSNSSGSPRVRSVSPRSSDSSRSRVKVAGSVGAITGRHSEAAKKEAEIDELQQKEEIAFRKRLEESRKKRLLPERDEDAELEKLMGMSQQNIEKFMKEQGNLGEKEK